jgi:hypothetical protein
MRACKVSVAAVLVLCACHDDTPVSFSMPVGIELKAKSSDVQNGAIEEDKAITTESGNPYGAFANASKAALGGADPSRVEVQGLTLLLGAASTGVTTLDQVFTGTVDVLFLMNDSNNTYHVGSINSPTGAGPDALTIDFSSASVTGDDHTRLLNGSFKVVLRGTAAQGFMGKNADASLQLTFTFVAFK